MQRRLFLLLPSFLGGCAVSRAPSSTVTGPDAPVSAEAVADSATQIVDQILTVRSARRVAELKSRGGECAAYGSVLETSLLGGRVSVRPFMWRVGDKLVSGEGRSDGKIVVARHIDRLNVGIRTVEDMVRTLEHEAAHVAFRLQNSRNPGIDQANDIVNACQGALLTP